MSHDEVLDPAVVADLRRIQDAPGNASFIGQLTALFREHCPLKMNRIREAIAARDAAGIEQVAHTLRTNCGMLGATRMADACGSIEDAARSGDFEAAARAFAVAEAECPLVLAAVSKLAQ